jgi:hypothetical protein
VALAILLFGMTAVLALLTYGTALSRSAHLRTSSSSAAQAVVLNLEETLFPDQDGQAGEPLPIVERRLDGAEGIVYSAQARPSPERPDEYRVDIDMSWSSQGVQREKRFTVLLLREVPFGERLRRQLVQPETPAPPPAAPGSTTPATPAPDAPPGGPRR